MKTKIGVMLFACCLILSCAKPRYKIEKRPLVALKDVYAMTGSFSTGLLGGTSGNITEEPEIRFAYKTDDGGIKIERWRSGVFYDWELEERTTFYETNSEPYVEIIYVIYNPGLFSSKKHFRRIDIYSAKFYIPKGSIISEYLIDLK